MRFLVVEDDGLIAWAIELAMSSRGHSVVGPTADPHVAQNLCKSGIDGAVLDIELRDGQNTEAVAQLLHDIDVPFVVHSGKATEDIPDACAYGLIVPKPCGPEKLVCALEGFVAKHDGT